jgi:hypothetical protein
VFGAEVPSRCPWGSFLDPLYLVGWAMPILNPGESESCVVGSAHPNGVSTAKKWVGVPSWLYLLAHTSLWDGTQRDKKGSNLRGISFHEERAPCEKQGVW